MILMNYQICNKCTKQWIISYTDRREFKKKIFPIKSRKKGLSADLNWAVTIISTDAGAGINCDPLPRGQVIPGVIHNTGQER